MEVSKFRPIGFSQMKKFGKTIVNIVKEEIHLPSSISILNDDKMRVKLEIYAKPGSKHNNIMSITDEEIAIQIAAPPRDGEANTELRSYISQVLGVKESQVGFLSGQKSRNKFLVVQGLDILDVYKKLSEEVHQK
jgi:uncharacterized protein (TIGR00251 family)